jgi:hypothetical protein
LIHTKIYTARGEYFGDFKILKFEDLKIKHDHAETPLEKPDFHNRKITSHEITPRKAWIINESLTMLRRLQLFLLMTGNFLSPSKTKMLTLFTKMSTSARFMLITYRCYAVFISCVASVINFLYSKL